MWRCGGAAAISKPFCRFRVPTCGRGAVLGTTITINFTRAIPKIIPTITLIALMTTFTRIEIIRAPMAIIISIRTITTDATRIISIVIRTCFNTAITTFTTRSIISMAIYQTIITTAMIIIIRTNIVTILLTAITLRGERERERERER